MCYLFDTLLHDINPFFCRWINSLDILRAVNCQLFYSRNLCQGNVPKPRLRLFYFFYYIIFACHTQIFVTHFPTLIGFYNIRRQD